MATFLSAQIPTIAQPRLQPNALGCVTDISNSTSPTALGATSQHGRPSDVSVQLLQQLKGLLKNKAYTGFKEDINVMCSYICDPQHCFQDSQMLLWDLVGRIFPNVYYLLVIKQNELVKD